MYQDAERIMVEDVGGAFLRAIAFKADLWQPYMAATGNCWEPDRQGLATTHCGQMNIAGAIITSPKRLWNYDTHRNE